MTAEYLFEEVDLPKRVSATDKHAGELFDLLAEGDKTSHEILERTEWSYTTFMKTTQRLRDILAADGDVINVVAEKQGYQQPWLYRLAAGKTIVDEEQSQWVINRILDSERRLKTIAAVLEVAVNATDGRTTFGKKAQLFYRHVTRALEDISQE